MLRRLWRPTNVSLAGLVILLTGSLAFLSNMSYLYQKTPNRIVFQRTNAQPNLTSAKLPHGMLPDGKLYATQVPYPELFKKSQAPKDAMITMFTSFRYSSKKETIHKNTIRNWSMLRPYVVPLLFADRDEVTDDIYNFTLAHGWTIAKVPKRSPGGVPVLRHMYMTAEKIFNTTFYCFANSDILFDPGFIRTLEMAVLPYRNQMQGLMLVGKRTNVAVHTNQDIRWFDEVTELGKKGTVFGENAQDYFVTTKGGFPWERIPDFVIGRAGYDNWLVARAMKERITTIDASNTVLALHQSGHDGDFAWKENESERNINVKLGGARIFYKIGHTNCTPFLTKWCTEAHNITEKTDTCPSSIVLAKRKIDYCYRLRRKLSIKTGRLINFKERMTT